ncbi:amidase family protein [Erysipelothrix urinaevulpis]|uniref:amidase family protein n=1 Tax=Erysipelothrix urinaevulpis TaxID=2683717 RepID=UPI00135AB9CF|nr:amidase family protein [Erysipelothrix urinaevulpis]
MKYNAIVEKLDIQTNKNDGKLHDWTFAIKDNVNLIGSKTTASSALLENHESIYNAHICDLLLAEGVHVTAKTSMDELAMGGTNRSALTGPVKNPYDPTRISGGSSGGSAALVASRDVRAAIGSDTGDSVRKPAAYCGIVGVKPSYGRISRYGVVPYASSLDHVAYFSQNVSDAALILEVLAGRDDRDMTSSYEPVDAYASLLDLDLKGKKIGVFKTVNDAVENKETQEAFNDVLNKLEEQGAILVEKTMDKALLRALLPTYLSIANAEASSNHSNLDGVRFGNAIAGENLDDLMKHTRGQLSLASKKRLIYGASMFLDEGDEILFNKAKRVRRLIVESYERLFDDIDVLLSIAAPNPAPKIEETQVKDLFSDEHLIADNYMVIDNFSGYPSLTQPMGMSDSMPIGLNISAKPFAETTMFAYAKKIESLIAWKGEF